MIVYVPKMERMTTAIRVQNPINGIWTDSPPGCFCSWNGKDEAGAMQHGGEPAWETSQLTLWHRPDISTGSRILLNGTAYYVQHVENVERRGKYLLLKVRRLIDLHVFKLFKPVPVEDAAGDIYNEYPAAYSTFEASMQPQGEDNTNAPYGVDLDYTFVLYTTDEIDLCEMDRFGVNGPEYEIKTIQVWPHYRKIMAVMVT